MAPPITRFISLLVKGASRPISNAIKRKVKTTPFLRNKFFIAPAQFYHRNDLAFKLQLKGIRDTSKIKPLPDDKAIDLTADMLGEIILLSILSLMLFLEYKRQQYLEDKKDSKFDQRVMSIEKDLKLAASRLEKHTNLMKEIDQILEAEEAEKSKTEAKAKGGETVCKGRQIVFRADDTNKTVTVFQKDKVLIQVSLKHQ